MSLKETRFEENLTILNYQMDVLARFVGYLTSYTVSDDEIEHVKKYVADNVEKCRIKTGTPKQELQEMQAAAAVWLSIQDQLQS